MTLRKAAGRLGLKGLKDTAGQRFGPTLSAVLQKRGEKHPAKKDLKQHPHHEGYLRFARAMRWVLPGLAICLAGLLFFYSTFRSLLPDSSFSLMNWDVASDLTKSLAEFQFFGVDDSNRPYHIGASRVIKGEENEAASAGATYLLDYPQARLVLRGGEEMILSSLDGDYLRDESRLVLRGQVSLYQDEEFELVTKAAEINLDAGTAEGADPVQGEGSFGVIISEGFRVEDKGAVIYFLGKTHLTLDPPDETATAPSGTDSQNLGN